MDRFIVLGARPVCAPTARRDLDLTAVEAVASSRRAPHVRPRAGPGRPDGGPDDGVEDHRARRTQQRRRLDVRGQPAEALAEPPDDHRPDERDGERRPDGPTGDDQAEPDRALQLGGQRVPEREVPTVEAGERRDRAADHRRLTGRGGCEHLGDERMRVHVGLELEDAGDQPQHPQCDLKAPAGDQRGRRPEPTTAATDPETPRAHRRADLLGGDARPRRPGRPAGAGW